MKKLLGLLMGTALLASLQVVWAGDSMGNMAGMSTPGMSATPTTKPAAKAKSAKKSKKSAKDVWVCPMGDYSGPKTKDGKCPKCGMDLMKQEMKKEDMKKDMGKPSAGTAAKTYVCSMDGYTSDKPGKCPKCGMDLVEKK